MKNLYLKCQWLFPLVISIFFVWLSSVVISEVDPSAGTFTLGFLHRPFMAAAYFFFADAMVWALLKTSFPSLDNWLDREEFFSAFSAGFTLREKVYYITGLLIIIFVFFSFCMCLIQVPA